MVNDECAVCFEQEKIDIYLHCGHRFHGACLIHLVKSLCPLCRQCIQYEVLQARKMWQNNIPQFPTENCLSLKSIEPFVNYIQCVPKPIFDMIRSQVDWAITVIVHNMQYEDRIDECLVLLQKMKFAKFGIQRNSALLTLNINFFDDYSNQTIITSREGIRNPLW